MKAITGREIQAVAFNHKEDKVLQKTLKTLSIEEDYSLKLINIHRKDCNRSQRRLKDRTNKIKSYLSPDEIAEIRSLELQGRLSPKIHTSHHSAAMQIATAARRLKLPSDHERKQPRRRAQSAIERRTVSQETEPRERKRPMTASPQILSVSRDSYDLPARSRSSSIRRESPIQEEVVEYNSKPCIARPSTSIPRDRDLAFPQKKARAKSAFVPSTQRRRSTSETSFTNYDQLMTDSATRRTSAMSDSSLGSRKLLNEQISEMKKELLEIAQEDNEKLKERTTDFVKRIEMNPDLRSVSPNFDEAQIKSIIQKHSSEEFTRISSENRTKSHSVIGPSSDGVKEINGNHINGLATPPKTPPKPVSNEWMLKPDPTRRYSKQGKSLNILNMLRDIGDNPKTERDVCLSKIKEAWEDVKECQYTKKKTKPPSVIVTKPNEDKVQSYSRRYKSRALGGIW